MCRPRPWQQRCKKKSILSTLVAVERRIQEAATYSSDPACVVPINTRGKWDLKIATTKMQMLLPQNIEEVLFQNPVQKETSEWHFVKRTVASLPIERHRVLFHIFVSHMVAHVIGYAGAGLFLAERGRPFRVHSESSGQPNMWAQWVSLAHFVCSWRFKRHGHWYQ